jgi:ubiquinone/menaquinone biosynthesis C-methylase UbiE
MKLAELAKQILCCPDCRGDLDADLLCMSCGRSLTPGEDGIIGALPLSMLKVQPGREHLQNVIAESAPAEQGAAIVLYEKAFHDDQARYYDKVFADPLPLGAYYKRLVHRHIYSYVRQKSFVIDLCCGTGKSSLPLAERGLPVVGIDVSIEMLRVYKRKCDAHATDNVLLVHADASRPPLRKASCGAITLIGGLHHIPQREECVQICCNALTAGGMLIVHEPLKTGKTSAISALLNNLYAAADPVRVWAAVKRRIGLQSVTVEAPVENRELDFTPYERPFTSAQELEGMVPGGIETLTLRSQGTLSFRDLPQLLQGRMGVPLSSVIVRLDDWLSSTGRTGWTGDAIFAVFRKT